MVRRPKVSTGGKAPRLGHWLLRVPLSENTNDETWGGELQIEFETGVYTTHSLVWLSPALPFSTVLRCVKPAAQTTNVLQHVVIPVSASELCDIATNLIGKLPETETLHARFYGLENSISAIATSKDWATSFKVNVYPTSHKDDVLTLLKMIKIIAATLCVETKSATQSAQGLSETQRKFSNLLWRQLDKHMRSKGGRPRQALACYHRSYK